MARPFRLREINILAWNVLNGRIRGFAESEGIARIRNHTARDGHDDGLGKGPLPSMTYDAP
jgi:hypothetical protein